MRVVPTAQGSAPRVARWSVTTVTVPLRFPTMAVINALSQYGDLSLAPAAPSHGCPACSLTASTEHTGKRLQRASQRSPARSELRRLDDLLVNYQLTTLLTGSIRKLTVTTSY